MRKFLLIAAIGVFGVGGPVAAPPAAAEQTGSVASVLAEALPQTIDGWARRTVTVEDLDRLFGAIGTAEAGSTGAAAGTEVVQTARRGRRAQTLSGDSSAARPAANPLRTRLEAMVRQAQGYKTTARRGRRHNPAKTGATPAFAYEHDAALVVLVAGSGGLPTAALSDGIEVASQEDLAAQLAGEAFLTVGDVTFVELEGRAAEATRLLVGKVGENAHLLVLAQAEPDRIQAILSAVDFAPLRAWMPPTTADRETSGRTKRSRR